MARKKKASKKISMIVIAIIILIMAVFGLDELFFEELNNVTNTANTVNEVTNEAEQKEFVAQDDLKVYFIDVGQADSILIVNKDQTMLIDAGNNEDGEQVVNFIKDKGITKLNYVIGTHPHEDHIGGLDNVINTFDIENVYLPNATTTTKTFEDVINAIQGKGLKIKSPEEGYKFKLGEANCEVMLARIDTSNLNNSSIVLRLEFGNKSFLFMGDTESANESLRQWPQTTVLKVGHHGSDTSSSESFLNQVKPEIAVIMVGEGNDYGHPKQEIINRLENIGAKIYRTDKNGTITMTTDGNKIEVNTEK